MATFQTALAKGIDAVDELCLAMGQPTVSSQLGQVVQLQADLTTMTADRDAQKTLATNRKTTIDAMLTELGKSKTADVAEDAGRDAAIQLGQGA